jgi:hypothetical protein
MTDAWWQAAPLAPANDPSFTGYIPGTPKPKEPKAPVFVPQGATQMFDPNTNTYVPVPKAAGADDEDKGKIKTAIEGMGVDELISSLSRARDNLKTGWATGTWGALAELKPGGGTPRDNFLGQLTAIQGGIINEKLAALKELSKTGASGLGALSEKEGERLASSVAALTPNMSPDEYERSFKEIAKHALTLRAIRDDKDPNSPAVAKEIEQEATRISALNAAPPPVAPNTTSALDRPIETPAEAAGVTNLSDDQKRAYDAFLTANPNPSGDQVGAFLSKLTGKTVPNGEEIAKAIRQGRGINTTVQDIGYKDKLKTRIAAEDKMGLGDDPATTLAVQGGTLNLSDEAAGVGNALAGIVSAPFTGKLDIGGDYRFGRDEERMRIADARQQLGYGGTAIELVSGAGSGAPTAALNLLPRAAAAVAAGKAGAVGGALAGFGSGEGTGGSVGGATIGAAAGGALGRYAPAAIERVLPRRLRTPQGMAPDVADAAAAEGVDLIRPMVDPASRSDYGALESNIYSQPIIRGAAGRVRGQIEDRVSHLAPTGVALEPNAAGDVIQGAGNRFITKSRNIKNRLYDRADNLGGTTAVKTTEAQGQIDQELSQLAEAPETNAAEIGFLQNLKSDLSQPQTVGSIRRIRTSLRGQINNANLTATTAEARAMRVLDAAKNDIQRDAPPAAASAYARADAFNRERQTHIDTVLRDFLGKRDQPLDSEKAFSRLKSLASPGGGGRRLAAIMRNLEPDERQDIAATIAQSLGRRSADEPFSTALFVSQTSKLSPAARRTIFGPDGAQSIENLRSLSRKLEEAEKDINRSRSATVLERQGVRSAARAFIAGIAGLGAQAATGDLRVGIAGAGVAAGAMGVNATRRVLSARAMVNPRVSRWLAESATASTPAQAKEATRKLGVIIAREPALAHELQPVYAFLENKLAVPLPAAEKGGGGDDDRR